MNASTEKFSTRLSVSRNSSDNDYTFLGTDLKNDNGEFYNTSVNLALGYQFNTKNYIKFYSEVFDGERHFSRTLAAPSKSKYQDTNSRNLVELTNIFGKMISTTRVAFLAENYKYFEDKYEENHSYGKSETAILKYDLLYTISKNINLNALV